ncbi:unnamed protein product [Caenorhabditis nigoni]|nr:hypothetical protein B9Z55_005758 [Caenorhabditis nigoni]
MELPEDALSENLYAFALASTQIKEYCNRCLTNTTRLKKCAGCNEFFYCSQECQKMDWKIHKPECKSIQEHGTLASDSMRLAMRIIVLLGKKNFGHVTASYISTGSRSFLTLVDHGSFLDSGAEAFYQEYLNFALPPYPEPDVVKSVFKKISINGFSVSNSMGSAIGHGLCIKLSAANHSCKPLTRVCYRNRTAMLVPIDPYKPPTSLEGACHSYIDELQPVSARQAELKKKYNFICICEGCMDDERNEAMEAWACGDCANGKVPNVEDGRCGSCGWKMTRDHYELCRTAEESAIAAKPKIENESIPLETRKVLCEKLMELFDETLHAFNVHRVVPQRLLFFASLAVQDINGASKHGKALLAMMMRYQGEHDPIVMLKKWQIAQICHANGEYNEVVKLLEEIHAPLKEIYTADAPISLNIGRLMEMARSELQKSR